MSKGEDARRQRQPLFEADGVLERRLGTRTRAVWYRSTRPALRLYHVGRKLGGGGARYDRDGIDTGGFVRSLGCAIANVETYEFRYPLLYLYRRQEPDTGGPGKFRGGAGIGLAMTPHDVEEIPTCVVHGCGIEQPASAGIAGGYPGSTTQFNIRRNTSVQAQLQRGHIPVNFDALDGELEPKSSEDTFLKKGDVFERGGLRRRRLR